MKSETEDLPTIMASIMVAVPKLALGTGVAYLRMKRNARRGAKTVYRELVGSGIPEEAARKLSESYASELSIRNLAQKFGMPFDRSRSDWNPGK